MPLEVLTGELGDRIARAATDGMVSRVTALQRQAGNPCRVAIERFGGATAIITRDIPTPHFNRVMGLGDGDEVFLDDIVAWYRQCRMPCRFDVVPMRSSEALLLELARRGFYQSSFLTTLYGAPRWAGPSEPTGVGIEEVQSDQWETFAEVYFRGLGSPLVDESNAIRTIAINNVKVQYSQPPWRAYLAWVDGNPAAAATLHTLDRVGWLAVAATLPAFRCRGCHTALLHRRIADAAAAGCDLLAAGAKPGSASQRNMQRAGLRIAYTTAIWTRRPRRSASRA